MDAGMMRSTRTHLESSMEMIEGRRSVVYLSTQSSGDAYGAGARCQRMRLPCDNFWLSLSTRE